MSSPCRSVGHLVQAYLDGELSAPQVLEVEKHTQSCSTCAERIMLDRAMRASLRREVAARKPDAGFRDRVAASLTAERNRSAQPQWMALRSNDTRAAGGSTFGWRNLLLVAATFAVAVPIGVQLRNRNLSSARPPVETASAATVDIDTLIDRFVDWHAHPLPPEITSTGDFPAFEPYVGVPVRPPTFTVVSAQLLGARILPFQEQRATAMLQYKTQTGNHRISVYVYDPRRIKTTQSRLRSQVMNSEPVYVGHVGGYAVAAGQRKGIGYAVASDLEDNENAELVMAAAR
jgi:anti-sigma factor RsiW